MLRENGKGNNRRKEKTPFLSAFVSRVSLLCDRRQSVVSQPTGIFWFINRVGNVNWPPLRVSKLTFRALALRQSERSNEGLTLETSALSISLLRPIHIINPVEKTKLSCYTPPPTKYHNFLRNLPPLFRYFPRPVLHKD